MEFLESFADARHGAWCIHCGGSRSAAICNEDHVPSRVFLRKPFPTYLPTVSVCKACNSGLSLDEEYFAAFLSVVLAGSTEPEAQADARIGRALTRSAKLRGRLEAAKREVTGVDGVTTALWIPESDRIDRIVLKNARGHCFYELGEPQLSEPDAVGCVPLIHMAKDERSSFERIEQPAVWPEVGSRLMTRMLTGQDMQDGWIIVQPGTYRYAVLYGGGAVTVRSVIHEYLATEVVWG